MKINIYTDGACSGNPGPGGRGSVIHIYDDHINHAKHKQILLSGQENHTTNNQMELLSIIKSAEYICDNILPKQVSQNISIIYPQISNINIGSIFGPNIDISSINIESNLDINIYTDSKYVYDGVLGYIENWKKNGRKLSNRKPVANQELRKKLDFWNTIYCIGRNRVKGHASNKYNNLADQLATGKIKPIL